MNQSHDRNFTALICASFVSLVIWSSICTKMLMFNFHCGLNSSNNFSTKCCWTVKLNFHLCGIYREKVSHITKSCMKQDRTQTIPGTEQTLDRTQKVATHMTCSSTPSLIHWTKQSGKGIQAKGVFMRVSCKTTGDT